jgi:arylformamidase
MKLYRDFASQEEIDREYNLALRVPDMPACLERFTAAAAAARRELKCRLDLRYGPTLEETMDIFPSPVPDSPILVFIHGGYWRWGRSRDFSWVARGPVRSGVTVAVTNYGLCPKATLSEIIRQSRAAVAWLHREAPSFNGDPDRIYALGHSAGGQQVGMLAATDWTDDYGLPADTVKGGVAVSGIFDLRPLRYSWLQPKLLLSHEDIHRQSPLFNIPASGPPLLISVGEHESAEFHRQARAYVDAYRTGGWSAELTVAAGKHHFTVIEALADADSPFCRAVVEFVRR